VRRADAAHRLTENKGLFHQGFAFRSYSKMKIVVVGSLRDVPCHADICAQFVSKLGELIIERNHTLLTGCRGSLDKAIVESAHARLQGLQKDSRAQLVCYRLRDAEPVFRYGTIYISSLKDWELTQPELTPPEQIATADVAIFIAGRDGTFIAANWARIAGIPVLGIAQFGGAGEALYGLEHKQFEKKYAGSITREEFEILNQDTLEINLLAQDVICLAERIVTPRKVFTVMPFTPEFRDVFASYREVCKEFSFEALRTDEVETDERIVDRIIEGIRTAAFVIADVSEIRPNVFYELGFAQGFGKEVVVTAKKGTTLPFDISDVPVIFWDGQENLKEQLRRRIRDLATRLRRSVVPVPVPHQTDDG
jgi:hypothetical protein